MPQEEIHDSPVDWVAKHIRDYVETGGRQRKGTRPKLLLTTRGRHTGKLRRTALYYWNDGDDYLLVGSDGGSAQHPAWYLNLTAQPEVTVQIGAESFAARARTASQEGSRAFGQSWSQTCRCTTGSSARPSAIFRWSS